MTGPLDGVRVLEVASYVAAPSAGVIMAGLGADVVKVEPLTGDPLRGMMRRPVLPEGGAELDPGFEVDNRGKRSVCIAVDRPEGGELVRRLVAGVDVVLLNVVRPSQERFGLDPASLLAVNPRLVHATMTGYGTTGPDAWRPGYDVTAFFGRGAVSEVATEPEGAPPQPGQGQGDHTAGLAFAIAVLAGLRQAERTGEGQVVESSLFSTAVWTMASDVAPTLLDRKRRTPRDRRHALNALSNRYRCGDGRWLILLVRAGDAWARFCAAIDRPDLATDPRYLTAKSRHDAMPELVDTLDEVFARRSLAEWGRVFDDHGLAWGGAQRLDEVVDDPQARAADLFCALPHPEHGPFDTVALPLRIEGLDLAPTAPAPKPGEHTAAVLGGLGLSEGDIADLVASGIVR